MHKWAKKGKGRPRRKPGTMNKLEAAWADVLERQGMAGELMWFQFEGITLKLAPDTRYTPDFVWQDKNGEIVFDETKGFMQDDAWVKLKVAADKFPFRFRLVKKKPAKDGGGWDVKEIGSV